MFVFSVKMSKRQMVTLVFCIAVLAAMLIAALRDPSSATAGGVVTGGSEVQRVAFLRSLGYTVTPPHTAVKEITLPDVFDETTVSYNELQQQAGMDLAPYHGKRLKCWTYAVEGDPSGKETEAHLYEYKGTIVAGDIAAKEADGFMRPLIPVEKALG